MQFCYYKLSEKIFEVCKTRTEFAKLLGVSLKTLSAKLENKSEFTQSEILKAVTILNINPAEISSYFFCQRV